MAGPVRRLASAAVILALAAGCGQARAGTALPKGDDASAYVGAKFEQAMAKLRERIAYTKDATSSLDKYFRVDDKFVHAVLGTVRTGSPESRVLRNHSLRNPDDILDTFTPAAGAVEYAYHGAAYKSLAPTPWVSIPKPNGGALIEPCSWVGLVTPCRMANAAFTAYEADKGAVKGAKSMGDGKIELIVEVPLGTFFDERVLTLPPKLSEKVSEKLKKSAIPTTITMNADGSPTSFIMEAKFDGDGHKIELRFDFKFTGQASAQDLPNVPDPAQLTVLDQSGANEYYRRLGELQDASG